MRGGGQHLAMRPSVICQSLDETRLSLAAKTHSGMQWCHAGCCHAPCFSAATNCSLEFPLEMQSNGMPKCIDARTLAKAQSALKPTHEGNCLGISASPLEPRTKIFIVPDMAEVWTGTRGIFQSLPDCHNKTNAILDCNIFQVCREGLVHGQDDMLDLVFELVLCHICQQRRGARGQCPRLP